jgi:hypothetical protein
VVREVTAEHLARMRKDTEYYVRNWRRYRSDLRAEGG